jgi:hypothetical protein
MVRRISLNALRENRESRFDTLYCLADDRDQPPKNAGAHRPSRRNHVQMF